MELATLNHLVIIWRNIQSFSEWMHTSDCIITCRYIARVPLLAAAFLFFFINGILCLGNVSFQHFQIKPLYVSAFHLFYAVVTVSYLLSFGNSAEFGSLWIPWHISACSLLMRLFKIARTKVRERKHFFSWLQHPSD